MQLSADDGGPAPTRPEARPAEAGGRPPRRSAGARLAGLRVFGLVAGIAVLVALAQTPPGRSLMRLTGLAKSPAPYSALYFTDPRGLPASVPAGHVGLNVSFAVHNATGSGNTYRWTVRVVEAAKTRSAASGTLTVAAGGTQRENTQVSVLCPSGTLDVVVQLAAPAESIDSKAACG